MGSGVRRQGVKEPDRQERRDLLLLSALSSMLWFLMVGGSAISFLTGLELLSRVNFQKYSSASWRGGELEEKGDLFLFLDALQWRCWDALESPRRDHPDCSHNSPGTSSGIDPSCTWLARKAGDSQIKAGITDL